MWSLCVAANNTISEYTFLFFIFILTQPQYYIIVYMISIVHFKS
jgi:hypothetical protein